MAWAYFTVKDAEDKTSTMKWMLHFEEQSIGEEYKMIESYHLVKLDKWSNKLKTNQNFILNFDTSDPTFMIYPCNNVENKEVAFRFKGGMLLTNQESNPEFLLTFFKSGKEKSIIHQYIGNRIDYLNKWQNFEKDLILNNKDLGFDSVQVILTKGYPLTHVKNIEVQQFLER